MMLADTTQLLSSAFLCYATTEPDSQVLLSLLHPGSAAFSLDLDGLVGLTVLSAYFSVRHLLSLDPAFHFCKNCFFSMGSRATIRESSFMNNHHGGFSISVVAYEIT